METTTSSATYTLRQDHVAVLAALDRLRTAGNKLASQSEAERGEATTTIAEVAAFMGRDLEIHLQKEEDALFPPMEAIMGAGGGPTTVMRHEHVDMRAGSQALQDHAAEFGDAERTRQNIQKIQGTIGSFIDLLTQHIHKEDFILFNMADDMLSPQAVQQALAKMQELEAR